MLGVFAFEVSYAYVHYLRLDITLIIVYTESVSHYAESEDSALKLQNLDLALIKTAA